MEKQREEELEKELMKEERVIVYDEEEEIFAIGSFENKGYPENDAVIMVYSIFRNEKKKLRCECGSKKFIKVKSQMVGEYGEVLDGQEKSEGIFICQTCALIVKPKHILEE